MTTTYDLTAAHELARIEACATRIEEACLNRIENLEADLAEERAARVKADAQMAVVLREWCFHLEEKAGRTEGRLDDLLQALTAAFNMGHVVLETVAARFAGEDLEDRGSCGDSGASDDDRDAVMGMEIPPATHP